MHALLAIVIQPSGPAASAGDVLTIVNGVIDFAFLVTWTALPRLLGQAGWWHTRVGTNLFVFLTCLDAIWGISAWHHVTGNFTEYLPVRAFLYGAFAVLGVWRLAELLMAQPWRRPDPAGDEKAERVAP